MPGAPSARHSAVRAASVRPGPNIGLTGLPRAASCASRAKASLSPAGHGLVQIVLLAEIVLALKTRDPTFGREDIGYKIGDILTEAELMQCAERALAQVEAGVLTTAALGEPIPLNLQ